MTTQATQPPQVTGRSAEERAELIRRRNLTADPSARPVEPRPAPPVSAGAPLLPVDQMPAAQTRPVSARPKAVPVPAESSGSSVLPMDTHVAARSAEAEEARAARIAARRKLMAERAMSAAMDAQAAPAARAAGRLRPVVVEAPPEATQIVPAPVESRPVRERLSPEARAARLAMRRNARAPLPEVSPDDEVVEEAEIPPPRLTQRDEALVQALPKRRTRVRMSVPLLSFLVMVLLPTFIASVYYVAIASDQYVSEFRFSIRKQESTANIGSAQSASGFSPADALQMMADNFVIIDYLRSRTALDELSKRLDFDRIYTTDIADRLSRLTTDASSEERLDYWQRTIDAAYDMTTGITTVTVRSFRPEDTLQVADALVDMSEGLVNNLQARARHDAVSFFEGEVARAEQRLSTSQRAVLEFRDKNQITDPESSAQGVLDTYNKLQGDLVSMRAELASLLTSMKPNAPTVQVLKSRIAAGEVELGKLRARIGNNTGADGHRLSDVIDRYETLQREQEFAEKLYTSALTSLETARINTAMQHSYLATFVQPALAHDSLYPNRLRSIIAVLFISIFVWMVALLSGYAIRDHAI